MKKIFHLAGVLTTLIVFAVPVLASAASLSIQNLTPGTSVFAKNTLSFNVLATDLIPQFYTVTDSFNSTSLSSANINGSGNFSWTPNVADVGTHNITVKTTNTDGAMVSTDLYVVVMPPPSVAIQNLAPGSAVPTGGKLTFSVTQTGFTNPTYIVGDAFSGSSVSNANLDASGNFSWTPDIPQNGQHTITVYASDTLGHSAQASVQIQVGAGPQIVVQTVAPSNSVSPGQTVTFSANAYNFIPTAYSIADSLGNKSTVSNLNINTAGAFSWMTQQGDVGVHVLIVTGQVGAYGDKATTSVTVTVLGAGGTVSSTVSGTSSSTAIAALQAQLAALNSQIASQSSSAGNSSAASVTFTSYLKPGSEGDEVTRLQTILIQKGYLSGEATGFYGSKTVDAVVALQKANGLAQLGVVGPATRALLNSMQGSSASAAASTMTTVTTPQGSGYVFEHFMGFGDDDSDVTELQTRLITLGYMSGSPTGFYGGLTEAAVRKFQTAKKIPVVGYVDKTTRAALNQ